MSRLDELVFSPPELGNVLYLPGPPGGGSKIGDRSPYGNVGTITGATWTKLPSGLWYLGFDGVDDYVETAFAPVSGYPFTLMGWLNWTSGDRALLSLARSDATDVWWYIGVNSGTGKALMEAKNPDSCWKEGGPGLSGAWHFIAAVFASATSRELFVDGVSVASDNRSVSYSSTNIRCRLGSLGDSTPQYLKAGIALARVFNIPLSALQIRRIFAQEKHLFGVW